MKDPREKARKEKGQPKHLPPGGRAAGRAHQFELERGIDKGKAGKVMPDQPAADGGQQENETAE